MPILRCALILTFFYCLMLPAMAAGIDWEKPVNLKVEGKGIGEAISQITDQTGVVILLSPEVNGADGAVWKEPVYITARSMPLRQAVDWLARICSARYHVNNEGKVYFDYGYGWVDKSNFDMILRNVETLVGQKRDVADFERVIAEGTKVLTLFDSGFYARIEEQGEQIKLVANIPADLKDIFTKFLLNMELEGDAVGRVSPARLSRHEQRLISKLYSPVIVAYKDLPLSEIVADLSAQTGVNIGFSHKIFRGRAMPVVSLDKGRMTLRAALEELVAATELKGIELSLPNGIWLGTNASKWGKMASREFLWKNNAVVKSFNLKELAGSGVDGNYLAHQIKMKVCPQAWNDPLATAVYHASSSNLIIIGTEQMQTLAANALSKYFIRNKQKTRK